MTVEEVKPTPDWSCREGITCQHPNAPRMAGACLGCHPKDPANGRYLCTRAHPMPAGQVQGQWSHAEAVDAGECADGCCDYYRCHACGTRWKTEVAQ